jgi:hypothetical protein
MFSVDERFLNQTKQGIFNCALNVRKQDVPLPMLREVSSSWRNAIYNTSAVSASVSIATTTNRSTNVITCFSTAIFDQHVFEAAVCFGKHIKTLDFGESYVSDTALSTVASSCTRFVELLGAMCMNCDHTGADDSIDSIQPPSLATIEKLFRNNHRLATLSVAVLMGIDTVRPEQSCFAPAPPDPDQHQQRLGKDVLELFGDSVHARYALPVRLAYRKRMLCQRLEHILALASSCQLPLVTFATYKPVQDVPWPSCAITRLFGTNYPKELLGKFPHQVPCFGAETKLFASKRAKQAVEEAEELNDGQILCVITDQLRACGDISFEVVLDQPSSLYRQSSTFYYSCPVKGCKHSCRSARALACHMAGERDSSHAGFDPAGTSSTPPSGSLCNECPGKVALLAFVHDRTHASYFNYKKWNRLPQFALQTIFSFLMRSIDDSLLDQSEAGTFKCTLAIRNNELPLPVLYEVSSLWRDSIDSMNTISSSVSIVNTAPHSYAITTATTLVSNERIIKAASSFGKHLMILDFGEQYVTDKALSAVAFGCTKLVEVVGTMCRTCDHTDCDSKLIQPPSMATIELFFRKNRRTLATLSVAVLMGIDQMQKHSLQKSCFPCVHPEAGQAGWEELSSHTRNARIQEHRKLLLVQKFENILTLASSNKLPLANLMVEEERFEQIGWGLPLPSVAIAQLCKLGSLTTLDLYDCSVHATNVAILLCSLVQLRSFKIRDQESDGGYFQDKSVPKEEPAGYAAAMGHCQPLLAMLSFDATAELSIHRNSGASVRGATARRLLVDRFIERCSLFPNLERLRVDSSVIALETIGQVLITCPRVCQLEIVDKYEHLSPPEDTEKTWIDLKDANTICETHPSVQVKFGGIEYEDIATTLAISLLATPERKLAERQAILAKRDRRSAARLAARSTAAQPDDEGDEECVIQ